MKYTFSDLLYRFERWKYHYTRVPIGYLKLFVARTFPTKSDGSIKILVINTDICNLKLNIGEFYDLDDNGVFEIDSDWELRDVFNEQGLHGSVKDKAIIAALSYVKYSWLWEKKIKEIADVLSVLKPTLKKIVVTGTRYPLTHIYIRSKVVLRFIRQQNITLKEFILNPKYVVLAQVEPKVLENLFNTGLLNKKHVKIFD